VSLKKKDRRVIGKADEVGKLTKKEKKTPKDPPSPLDYGIREGRSD